MKYKQRKDGFRSGFEAQVAPALLKAGYKYEPKTYQVLVPVRGHICQSCVENRYIVRQSHYTPDFVRWREIVEAKGNLTARNRGMLIAFAKQYPDLKFRVLLQKDNWLTKTHRMRYTDWCKKHDIVCAVGTKVPREWL